MLCCCVVLCCVVLCRVVSCCVVLCCVVLCCVVLCCVVLCCVVLCCVVLCCVVLCCVRCVAMQRVAFRCVAMGCGAVRCVALCCVVLCCVVLCCVVLCCVVYTTYYNTTHHTTSKKQNKKGEASHLATHTDSFSYTLPLGPLQSNTLAQLLGTPEGTIQGVHAGATAALPFLRFIDIAYRAYAVQPFHVPGLIWVDDTTVLLECGDTRPIKGVLLDQRTYYQGILWVDVLDLKFLDGSTSDP